MNSLRWLAFPWVLLLTGCAGTMAGLDGQGGFSCKAPDGISCASLSGVYANAVQNNLPGQRSGTKAEKAVEATAKISAVAPRSGDPLRSAQKVRRVWFAPWEDEDEVLHDQAYVYLVIDPGRWQIEHSRRKATEGFRPVMPPKIFTPQAPNAGERQTLQMERINPASGATSPLNAAGAQPPRTLPAAPPEAD
jgi:conjugal transfer pilus assembly protein TraV